MDGVRTVQALRRAAWKMGPDKIYVEGEICWLLSKEKWDHVWNMVNPLTSFFDPRIAKHGYLSFLTTSLYFDINQKPSEQSRIVHVCTSK